MKLYGQGLPLMDAGPVGAGTPDPGLLAENGSVNIDELKKKQLARFNKKIAEHNQEPRDQAWADRAEAGFTSGLQGLEKMIPSMHVEQVDCRTTTCSIRARWDTYEDARQTSRFIVMNPHYKINCASAILLPDPPDKSQPYEATALFNCTKARIAEVENER